MNTFKLLELKECESTNNEAWLHAPGPCLVTAQKQTRGRGRQGRVWNSAIEGNIFTSLVIPAPSQNLNWLPLAAGVAAIDALEIALKPLGSFDLSKLRLKWPNDIYWDFSKMGGILCESRILGEQASAVVIGFGFNFVEAPQITEMKTASFAQEVLAQKTISSERYSDISRFFIKTWAEQMLDWAALLSQNKTETLRSRWIKCAKLSTYAQFSVHDKSGSLIEAKALDLDANGKLKVQLPEESFASKIVLMDQADSI